MQQPEAVDVPESSRFEVLVDGEPAGSAEYRRGHGALAFTHTAVEPRFAGRVLGMVLIRSDLDAARAQGVQVLPHCGSVREFVQRHPDYLDLMPQERLAEFALARRVEHPRPGPPLPFPA